ncbi:ketol-acid reductoisomerase [Halococcus salifodinae]|uniref:Ketol-acid reductoisomerase n=1 Tax=Halococcus salifodinae DSM 8989 TaxID=1227456 RepID=M0N8T8_9EURY|nr:ketol-acid reductoisomerase [Halococcus salifodinae]EMA54301.1 ketol-acid reductoisomerase [Halococcus salifodinae DSM 8989]
MDSTDDDGDSDARGQSTASDSADGGTNSTDPELTATSTTASATVYHETDASTDPLDGDTVAVLGYGNQGRSQASNMRDAGLEVVIGNRADDSREQAREDGFDAYPMAEATARADVVLFLVPDEVQPEVYERTVEPNLGPGDALVFASGYNVTYGYVEVDPAVDVALVAPRMIGAVVRELYEAGRGAPALLAVHRDATGEAKSRALAVAAGIGSTRSGVVETDFETETRTDLLSEQGLFPVFAAALLARFEVESEAGVPPEVTLLESYLSREMAHIFEKCATEGLVAQMDLHSRTSQYGQLLGLEAFDREPIREFMRERLAAIESGEFAEEWTQEQAAEDSRLDRLRRQYENSAFVETEQTTLDAFGLREE